MRSGRSRIRQIALTAALLAGSASAHAPALSGSWSPGTRWQVTIQDAPDRPVQTVTLRVDSDGANSCLGGNWKRLTRVHGYYDGLSEPAYMISGNHLTILLASDICDAYDRLEGTLESGRFSGRHSFFGIHGSQYVGTAVAIQVR